MLYLWEIGKESGVLGTIYSRVLGNWITSPEEGRPCPSFSV
jgi:hypothetical protein